VVGSRKELSSYDKNKLIPPVAKLFLDNGIVTIEGPHTNISRENVT